MATDRALARMGGAFYLAGAIIAAGLVAWASEIAHRPIITALGTVVAALGALVLTEVVHLSPAGRRLMNIGGSTIISVVAVLAGPGTGSGALLWLFAFVPVDAFLFFAWRWALPMLGWTAVCSAIAVFAGGAASPAQWVAGMSVGCVVSVGIGWLVRAAAAAEQDPGTGMLRGRAFASAVAAQAEDADRTGFGFSLANVYLDTASDGLGPRPVSRTDVESHVRLLARRWQEAAPTGAVWGRVGAADFTLLWTAPTGLDEYLHTVLDLARPEFPAAIGVVDWQPGATALQLQAQALAAGDYSICAGGDQVTRAGLVGTQVAELRAALAAGQLLPHYQPIVDVATGRVRGAEALARWAHPDRGLLLPSDFIGLAEQSGLIDDLGDTILRQACRDAASWPQHKTLKISVNVSGDQLRRDDFPDRVLAHLRAAHLPAHQLVLEVTESTLAGDDPGAHEALRRLRAAGVQVAIDDFGTGWSNLTRLAALPVDVLKIDRAFVVDAGHDLRAQAMLDALFALAHRLGLRTVTEGIENHDQADVVTLSGAGEGQGWLYGRPVPAASFAASLRDSTD
ncbi:EAL domain-containing protein [Modestobacter italicus]|uniref:EAL domain-containing protein n=1 Tax=Modestobacter italicus (strain DSM 44449 / CECT 9708 / BC 501) TaxID=2732864 RepID=UPI00068512FC|nr:EAL domain-containing protein [Modestobacter marinus]